MKIHLAPLQGHTDHLYRRFHAQVYGAVDVCYTPFIRIEKGECRRQDMVRLECSIGDGTNLVPQIIFGSFDEFKTLVEAVKSKGYDHVDLNLGCPFPMQTNKGRGAAMITNTVVMQQVADYIRSDNATYLLKMRIGDKTESDWQSLLPILDTLSLDHITVHPRISKQMYDGDLYTDAFSELLSSSKNPIVWNADIRTIQDINRIIEQYPSLAGIMIGRGFLARPSIAEEWREGVELDFESRMDKIRQFHDLLFEAYEETLCGQTQILQKIKPFWEYLEPEIGHKGAKAIRKAVTLAKYRAAVDALPL